MKTYFIQRNFPGAGKLTYADKKEIARRSCRVIDELGHENIQWIHSYITGDNMWCLYKAISEEFLREHAIKGEFPITHIFEITGSFSPATAELTV